MANDVMEELFEALRTNGFGQKFMADGRAEGRSEGRAELLADLLRERFGDRPDADLTAHRLALWPDSAAAVHAIVTAPSWDDLPKDPPSA